MECPYCGEELRRIDYYGNCRVSEYIQRTILR